MDQLSVNLGLDGYGNHAHIIKAVWVPGSQVYHIAGI